ncbi:hypothetical protein PoB_007422300 [Plakobranchus ocellatus]|uniref:Uncharacterized protein n=1 Tax=Plakobranchus ocellatus TaxID=259542 RepID=A0AAV4DTV6_9GAST|nr:hypothetical protein PoB_007422300 [Plakobranchus ocellatus]
MRTPQDTQEHTRTQNDEITQGHIKTHENTDESTLGHTRTHENTNEVTLRHTITHENTVNPQQANLKLSGPLSGQGAGGGGLNPRQNGSCRSQGGLASLDGWEKAGKVREWGGRMSEKEEEEGEKRTIEGKVEKMEEMKKRERWSRWRG